MKDFSYELYEVQILLSRLQFINGTINDYVINSSDDESKLDFGNAINTFSDCIGMYAERLEKTIDSIENGLQQMRNQAINRKHKQK